MSIISVYHTRERILAGHAPGAMRVTPATTVLSASYALCAIPNRSTSRLHGVSAHSPLVTQPQGLHAGVIVRNRYVQLRQCTYYQNLLQTLQRTVSRRDTHAH